MAKERTPTSYLNDPWGPSDAPAKGVDGAGSAGDGNNDSGNPYRWEMPPSPEWGHDGESGTSYGHSDDVKDTGTKSSAWGMSAKDQARGYEGPERYDSGQYEQDVPQTNVHDRGAGSDSYAKEHSATTGRGFDGVGNDKRNPGTQQIGSMAIHPGNQAD